MIRLFVADDHEMFREMLSMALERHADLTVVGGVGDAANLCDAVRRCQPDIVLLDYRMPGMRGFDCLLHAVHDTCPRARVIVLSGFADPRIALQAAEGGARGYVVKSTRLAAVADAVRAVAAGGVWIDPNLPREVFHLFQAHSNGPATGPGVDCSLTRREREILACVAEGASNLAIAKKLSISEQTVKTHLYRIFNKLNVRNRVEAALAFYGRVGPAAPVEPANGSPG